MSATTIQNRTNSNVNGFNGGLPQLQFPNVQRLDDATCERHDLTGGPVFITREALESPDIDVALAWFNEAPEGIETGTTWQMGHGFEVLFGYNPGAAAREAFYVFVWKN